MQSIKNLTVSYKKWIILGVIGVIVLLLCGNACSTYNSLVSLDENCEQQWGNVQNQYQRRFDLIPNLVATVKGYAEHESQTFQKVTEARAGLTNAYNNAKHLSEQDLRDPDNLDNYTQSQSDLNRAFNIYVNAVTEAYPDLKANENFKDLQVQLEGTENRIATERTNYNDAVNAYNQKVRRFPGKIWAGMFGFQTRPMFKADSQAQSAPRVEF